MDEPNFAGVVDVLALQTLAMWVACIGNEAPTGVIEGLRHLSHTTLPFLAEKLGVTELPPNAVRAKIIADLWGNY